LTLTRSLACTFFLGGRTILNFEDFIPLDDNTPMEKVQPCEPKVNVPDEDRAVRLIEEYGTELQVMAEVRGYFQVAYKVLSVLLVT
jgi:hypothetical protein